MTMTPLHAGLDDVVGDPNRRLKVRLTNLAIDAFLIAVGLMMLLPLVFLVANAFKNSPTFRPSASISTTLFCNGLPGPVS